MNLRQALRAAAVILCFVASRAWAVDATWTGNDGVWSAGANWNTNPVVPSTATDSATIGAGMVAVDDEFSIGALTWTGGSIVRGTTPVAESVLTVAGAATISGPGEKHFATTTLNLNGATTWSEGPINTVETVANPEGGVVNIGGAFDVQFDGTWSWNATATPTINVGAAGSIVKSAGEGTAAFYPIVHNGGLVDVQSGSLHLAGGGLSGGAFTVAEGATLLISDFNQLYADAGAETTTLDVGSTIDASVGGTVEFTNLFGVSRTDVYGAIDAAFIHADPGETGIVLFHAGSTLGATSRGSYTANSGVTAFDAIAANVVDVIVNDGAVMDLVNLGTLNVSGAINVNEGGVLNVGVGTSGGLVVMDAAEEQLLTGSGEIVLPASTSYVKANHRLVIDEELLVRGRGRIFGASIADTELIGQNLGEIRADVSGATLWLNKVNNSGLISGVDGGTIDYWFATNEATIEVAGGGNLLTTAAINKGTMSIAGGTMRLLSVWDNDGTIKVLDGSTLELGGGFSPSNIGVIERVGTTTVRLVGELANSGQTLDLHTTTGSLELGAIQNGNFLSKGNISGGRVVSSGASALTSQGGNLSGVTLAIDLGMPSGTSTDVGIFDGLMLDNAKIFVGNGAMSFQGFTSQTLGGTGEVVLDGGTIQNSAQITVTIGPNVVLRGRGSVSGNVAGIGIIINTGTIRAEGAGSTLTLSGVRNSGGAIRATASNTVHIGSQSISYGLLQTAGNIIVESGGVITAQRPIDVQGGWLGGAGTVRITSALGAMMTVSNGGTVAPGESIGTLTIENGSLNVASGGRLAIELSGNSSDLLQLVRTTQNSEGNILLTSTNDYLDVTALAPLTATSYIIATYAGMLSGTFNHVTPGYSVTYDAVQRRIVLNVLPRADFNLDGSVDGDDLLAWQRGLGITSGATKAQGDANGDGAVNSADLALWRTQFGTPGAMAAGASVPEPGGVALALVAAVGAGFRRPPRLVRNSC